MASGRRRNSGLQPRPISYLRFPARLSPGLRFAGFSEGNAMPAGIDGFHAFENGKKRVRVSPSGILTVQVEIPNRVALTGSPIWNSTLSTTVTLPFVSIQNPGFSHYPDLRLAFEHSKKDCGNVRKSVGRIRNDKR